MDPELQSLLVRHLIENMKVMLILASRIGISPDRQESAKGLLAEIEKYRIGTTL